ncbi:unknown [Parabacteroides merdae CAG:48]|nr:unknown [Parabacteroides merdae CAG:48]
MEGNILKQALQKLINLFYLLIDKNYETYPLRPMLY